MSKAGQNMVLITKQRRYKVGNLEYFPGWYFLLITNGNSCHWYFPDNPAKIVVEKTQKL
jgi:hypothetical protein